MSLFSETGTFLRFSQQSLLQLVLLKVQPFHISR